jgi:hypothetical protein
MGDLLEKAIAAHGGRHRWRAIQTIRAHAAITGGIWHLKGKPGILEDVHLTARAHEQHLECAPFGAQGRHSVYEPGRTAIVTGSGDVIEERQSPREFFRGHGLTTPWDDQNLVYFSGYAMWTYLTVPFLLEWPGFESEEIAPWEEDGETWRRLEVTFPADVASHSRVQTVYFDDTGILRRHDYSADVLGGTTSANYALEPKTFGGLVFPTKRRVYALGPDNRPIRERVAVAIDLLDIQVA